MGKVLLRSLLWGLIGAVLLPIMLLVPIAILYFAAPICGRPGDSGGCEMGLASIFLSGIPVGAIVLFLFTLVRGAIRLDRRQPPVG